MQRNPTAIRLITTAIGINMILFGVSQVARPRGWSGYLPDKLDEALPLTREQKLRVHGLGNLSLGLLFVNQTRLKLTTPIVTAWWMFVAPLCGRKDWRAGARDISVIGALLALLTLLFAERDAKPR